MTPILLVVAGAAIVLLLFFAISRSVYRADPRQKPHPQRYISSRIDEEFSDELAQLTKVMTIPEPDFSEPAHEYPLPLTYGYDRLVLMVRDPHWLYAYWELTATRMTGLEAEYATRGWNVSRPVLRVYDVTGVDFNGSNAFSFFDHEVNPNADNWYFYVDQANRTYCADLGRVLPDGHFVTILRSNRVDTPRDAISEHLDEQWMWIEDLYRSIQYQTGISSVLVTQELFGRPGSLPLGVSSSFAVERHDHNH